MLDLENAVGDVLHHIQAIKAFGKLPLHEVLYYHDRTLLPFLLINFDLFCFSESFQLMAVTSELPVETKKKDDSLEIPSNRQHHPFFYEY